MKKLVNRIGDILFQISDRFFQGGNTFSPDDYGYKSDAVTAFNSHSVTWELNQGIEDIFWKDLKFVFNILTPSRIVDYLCKVYNASRFSCEMDFLMVEEPEKIVLRTESTPLSFSTHKQIVLQPGLEKKTGILYLPDWLKTRYLNTKSFLRSIKSDIIKLLRKNFILTRDDPGYDILSYKARGPDKSIFIPLHYFHRRN